MKDAMYIPTFQDMLDAHDRIKPHIHRTPVLTSSYFDELTGAELFFKCENFQKAGAFKVRGASNAVFGLSDQDAARGVCTHSSGNHALSLSYAAGRRGIPCNVVMPRTAPEAKKACLFAKVQAKTGGNFVHPYNDPRVIAGQGTCSREFMEQVSTETGGGLDMMVAPIGGGGMISGTCLTLSNIAPEVKIIASEPENADDAYRSFKAGHIITDDAPQTIADGLKVPLKERTWHFVSNHVSDILTASEDEIIDAMKLTWQRMKLVMEPSCAVPLATILKHKEMFAGKRVGVIVTGGNVDLDMLPWMLG
ncbi:putative serine racemase [Nymphon striatum]|nr:putative serine racemase [Nymphon striatum]